MALSILFCNEYLILDVEVRDIVFQVHILGHDEGTNHLVINFSDKAIVGRCWVNSAVVQGLVHRLGFVKAIGQISAGSKIILNNSLYEHVLIDERISMHDVENMLEGVLRLLARMGKLGQ